MVQLVEAASAASEGAASAPRCCLVAGEDVVEALREFWLRAAIYEKVYSVYRNQSQVGNITQVGSVTDLA